jgi:hypothetical protein
MRTIVNYGKGRMWKNEVVFLRYHHGICPEELIPVAIANIQAENLNHYLPNTRQEYQPINNDV